MSMGYDKVCEAIVLFLLSYPIDCLMTLWFSLRPFMGSRPACLELMILTDNAPTYIYKLM